MMPSLAQDDRPLQLLAGGAASLDTRLGWDGPPPVARPADRCEPWPIDGGLTPPFARAAADLGIAFELAAVVTVERSLLGEELECLGLEDARGTLDCNARVAAVTGELSEPLSAYLGALDRSLDARAHPRSRLVLPMRLTERIGPAGPASRLDVALLPSAIAWERAAVLAGRTMTEWALLVLAERAA